MNPFGSDMNLFMSETEAPASRIEATFQPRSRRLAQNSHKEAVG
jgi:hypothetical protein